jgi:glycosidase
MMRIYFFAFTFTTIFIACNKTDDPVVQPTPTISVLNCSTPQVSNFPLVGIEYSATVIVSYEGGNGAMYTAGSPIASTGITGLSAILQAGTLANGTGNLTFSISGTASAVGAAAFDISVGTKTCTLILNVINNGPSQYGIPFQHVPDRQDATIYEVNIRAFSTQGGLQGVTARLDSIHALGVNVIYLMPTYPVGSLNGVNSPYCVKDYKSVNPEFGNLDDLRNLVENAHTKDMSVIMDWVANHTSWDNAWITAHKDWYLQDGSGHIVSPPGTGWNDVAQLNFTNAEMRLEMIESMKYWIYTANVDGFRMDYANGPPADFWKQTIDSLRNITTHHLLLLAEGDKSDLFADGFDFTFGFNFYGQLKNIYKNNQPVTGINTLNTSEFANASNGQQVVRYLTNHDVNGSDGTPLDLFGGIPGSMAAFVVVAYMKGVPMIYNGQEVGFPTRITFPFTSVNINWTLNPAITAEYKKVIAFRNQSAAIRRGQLTSYSNTNICAFTKEHESEIVFVASNLRNTAISFSLPAGVANSTWTDALSGAMVSTTGQIDLGAYSYVVLRK